MLNVFFLMVPFLLCDFTTFRVFFLMCFVFLLIFKFFHLFCTMFVNFISIFIKKQNFFTTTFQKHEKHQKNITLFKQTNLFWVVKTMFVHKENDVLIFFFYWCFIVLILLDVFFMIFVLFWFCNFVFGISFCNAVVQAKKWRKQTNKQKTNK